MTIAPPAGRGFVRHYYMSSALGVVYNALDVVEAINRDHDKGYIQYTAAVVVDGPMYVQVDSLSDRMCSGGIDGTLAVSDLSAILDIHDLSNVGVIHFAGILMDDIETAISEQYLEALPFPTSFVQGVYYDFSSGLTNSSYASGVVALANSWTEHWLLSYVVGEGSFVYGGIAPYWGSMAPIYAAILANTSVGTTRVPTHVSSIRPFFDNGTLDLLANAGFVCFVHTISVGNAVYVGTPSDVEWPAIVVSVYTRTAKALSSILEPLVGIGETSIDKELINAQVNEALMYMGGVRDFSYSITYGVGTIYIDITLYIDGELRSIEFGVGVKTGG